jgi:hypothetical protein
MILTYLNNLSVLFLFFSIQSVEAYQQSNSINGAKQNKHTLLLKPASRRDTTVPSPLLLPRLGNSVHRSLLGVSSDAVSPASTSRWQAPTIWESPLPPVKNHNTDGDWIDGDLFLSSHLNDDDSPNALPTYAENLRRQVEETSRSVEMAIEELQPQKAAVKAHTTKDHQESKGELKSISHLDLALFGTYFCNAVAMTIPVILMPLVAAERVAGTQISTAAVVATFAYNLCLYTWESSRQNLKRLCVSENWRKAHCLDLYAGISGLFVGAVFQSCFQCQCSPCLE